MTRQVPPLISPAEQTDERMKSSPSLWSRDASEPRLLSQILLCLQDHEQAGLQIELAVSLAQQTRARLRGLTLFDSSAFDEQVRTSESAAPVILEMTRLQKLEDRYRELRQSFSQACLAADLDFDLRQEQGRPREILVAQARSHDLVIVGLPLRRTWSSTSLSPAELVDAIPQGAQPLLILRESAQLPQRVLLVHDGSAPSDRAIKAYTGRPLFPGADLRLLAVRENAEEAQQLMRHVGEHLRSRWPEVETGFSAGRAQALVPEYARHWNADLVVMGVPRSQILSRALYGETVHNVLQQTTCAVYGAA